MISGERWNAMVAHQTASRHGRRVRRIRWVMALAVFAGVTMAGCSPQKDASASADSTASAGHVSVSDYHGAVLGTPLAKPDFTFTDTKGQPFDFRAATSGYVTFLYFGYTNCPDVCPVHMANIAAALKQVSPDVRRHVKVVFVTTDPDRDTPQRLRSWLDNFDSTFVGLRGPMDEVNRVQAALNMEPAEKVAEADGNYAVGHSALVVAFSLDNQAHVVYPFGVQKADWAHDIPLLVRDTSRAG